VIGRWAFALVLFAVSFPRVALADSEAAARKHATRANKLAAQNKCRSAVSEFNRAYETLKDPILLFNRAECQRKLGNAEEALKDYEQFLSDMPTAPNRAGVEAHIASLRAALQNRPSSSAPAQPAPTPDVGAKPEKKVEPAPRAQKWD
jgi:tetratricopeptide (TPR) repeat protein